LIPSTLIGTISRVEGIKVVANQVPNPINSCNSINHLPVKYNYAQLIRLSRLQHLLDHLLHPVPSVGHIPGLREAMHQQLCQPLLFPIAYCSKAVIISLGLVIDCECLVSATRDKHVQSDSGLFQLVLGQVKVETIGSRWLGFNAKD